MEVVPGVYQINVQRVSNCFFVTEPVLTLVDCGIPQQAGKIAACVAESGYSINDVHRLILTHGDLDHVGSAQELCRVTGMRAYMHSGDLPYVLGERRPRSPLRAISASILRTRMLYGPPRQTLPLSDGERIDDFLVVHTPGHTPGHVSLIWRGVLFAGDALITGDRFRLPPRLLCWDIREARRSVEKLLSYDFSIAVSGHGKPVTDARAKLLKLVESLQGRK